VLHRNFVSVCCHLQNGIHVVHSLQGQTGGTQKVPDCGCEEDGKKSPSHFCDCLTCEQAGVRPGIVMKEKGFFPVSFRTNSTHALSWFV
jgi:hypothetical protein